MIKFIHHKYTSIKYSNSEKLEAIINNCISQLYTCNKAMGLLHSVLLWCCILIPDGHDLVPTILHGFFLYWEQMVTETSCDDFDLDLYLQGNSAMI